MLCVVSDVDLTLEFCIDVGLNLEIFIWIIVDPTGELLFLGPIFLLFVPIWARFSQHSVYQLQAPTICCSFVAVTQRYRNTGIEGHIPDSASYTGCGQQATAQSNRWARANEHVAASKARGGGDTAQTKSEAEYPENPGKAGQTTNEIEISPAGPDGRHVRLKCYTLFRDSVRVIWKCITSPAQPIPTHAPLAKLLWFEILLDIIWFETIPSTGI